MGACSDDPTSNSTAATTASETSSVIQELKEQPPPAILPVVVGAPLVAPKPRTRSNSVGFLEPEGDPIRVSASVKSLHQSQHLLDEDLAMLVPSKSLDSADTFEFVDIDASSPSANSDIQAINSTNDASELARKVYQKGLEESHSRLLDMTDNFPHFNESEIVYGEILGKGCFGTVHEVRGFDLHDVEHTSVQRRRSFDLTRHYDVPDREVPEGDLESRKFMSANVFRKEGHARYAIKKLSPETIENTKQMVQGIADLVMEARILSAIEHPNIIKLRAIKTGDRFQPDFFIILDRLYETLAQRMEVWREEQNRGKNIFKHLTSRLVAFRHQRITKASSQQDRVLQAFHLSAALNYMHRQNLIHRDIKPENIGFDCRGDIKIFDYGMCKEMPNRNSKTCADTVYKFTGMCGSPRYMAPEVAHKRPYNEKCDVYSFAILFYEIMSLQAAYAHHHDFDTMFAQVWGPPYRRPNLAKLKLPEHLYRLIYSAWHYDYRKRPTMQHVADTLKEECLTFPNVTLQSLSHRRRKSKVIYDKEKCLFRVNSLFFDADASMQYDAKGGKADK